MGSRVYHDVYVDSSTRVVTLVRTEEPFASLDEIAREGERIAEVLRPIDRSRYGIVIDTRRGAGRNDEGFEEPFAAFRRAVMRGFRRVAVVASSAVGKLHVQRHARTDRAELAIFDDLGDARAFVTRE